MVKFVTPTRYDASLAKKGISVAVEENGLYFGTFDVKCYDPYDPFFKVNRERYQRVHKATIKALKDDQARSIHQFVHLAMFGWKDIVGEDGPVPFTHENAFEYLTETGVGLFVFGELFSQATDTDNFKAAELDAPDFEDETDPMKSVEEVSKN